MNSITTLLKTGHIAAASLLVFGLTGASAQASHAIDHSQGYKVMSMKDDLAHHSPDIHWPAGFEPEKADLFAAAALRKSDETLMHRGHDLWLATLKWVAEAKKCRPGPPVP